ncbi:MAG: AgmX/PglI C-terminal domain-containing protein [Bradymonadaceae bacterium]
MTERTIGVGPTVIAAILLTASGLGCRGCGEEPSAKPDVTADQPEPDTGPDLQKATEKAEKAAISAALAVNDQSRYLGGMLEASRSETDTDPQQTDDPPELKDKPTGKIDREKLKAVFRDHRGQARQCYERELKRDQGLRGTLLLTVVIGQDGEPLETTVEGRSLNNQAVLDCLRSRADDWTFPKPTGGPAKVRKPYEFSPKN